MDSLTAIGLDVAAVAVVVYCAYAAAKKGFLCTVVQMIAYVAVLAAALFFSRSAAPVVYDRVVEPILMRQELHEPTGDAVLVSASSNEEPASLDGIIGDTIDEFLGGESAGDVTDGLIGDLADATLRPMMISTISAIGFVLLFAVLSLAANILLSALGIINHLPVIGTLNAALGCVVGILQGLLIVWILGVLISGVLNLNSDGWWIFTQEAVGHTHIFHYFLTPELLARFQ